MQMRQNRNTIAAASEACTSFNRNIEGKCGAFHPDNKPTRMKQVKPTAVLRNFISAFIFIGILILSSVAMAQEEGFKVTGVVRDAVTEQPVAAAQIQSFNSEAAATTNENGEFEIELSTKSDVLVITAFDYNTREVAVKGKSTLDIKVYSDAFTSAFGNVKNLTGEKRASFTTEASQQMNEANYLGYASVDIPIQMEMGGSVRSIVRSGESGIGAAFFIRGLNSINANAQPLFVVDGVIWNNFYNVNSLHDGFFINTLADIDLNDIQNVTVLKDGTSIYGSKAANGVIIIDTKRGKGKATNITFNASGGITESPGFIPTMNGDQYRIYVTDLLGGTINVENFGDHPFLNDDPTAVTYLQYHNNTDWNEGLYQQSTTQSYNIAVNGGDDKALYNFSAGYFGNKGVVSSTNYNRLNTRFNADISMTDEFNLGLNIGFTNSDRVLLDDGVNLYTSPRFLSAIKAPFLNPYTYTTTGTLTTDFEDSDIFGVGNPLAIINNALNTTKHNRLSLGVVPSYIINKNLTLSSQFDYSLDKVKETYYSPIIGARDRYIEGYGWSANMFRSQQMRNISLFDDTRLTYKNTFNKIHNVEAILGYRYIYSYYESDFAEGHNSGTDQKRNLYSDLDYKIANGANERVRSISNYLKIDYNYLSKYFLSLSAALDGSSRFGRETQGGIQLMGHSWGMFPSLNAAWLLSSEEFMAGADFIDRLKLRASFGVTGNDDLDPYAWTTYFVSQRYIDRANAITIGNIGNDEIQWETSVKMNVGLDANLLNNRLALSADFYQSTTSDLLYLESLPEVAGSGLYLANGGSLSNTGYEFTANAKVLNTQALKWELSASMGSYKNEIIELPGGDYTTSMYDAEILTSVGNAAGLFYGYKTNGVFATEAAANEADLSIVNKNGTTTSFRAGDMIFEDVNDDHIIDENDKQIIGDPNPDFYGSLISRMTVGNLSFNAFFTYSYGNDVYNYMRYNLEAGSDYYNQSTAMLNRWTREGQVTMQPQASIGDKMGNSRFSDRWIEDGSYFKLRTVSIDYKIDLKSDVIRGFTVSVSANNLFSLSNYLGLDPEVSPNNGVLYQGIDTGLVPASRSYLIGIKMNL